jgi:hypothetical protein
MISESTLSCPVPNEPEKRYYINLEFIAVAERQLSNLNALNYSGCYALRSLLNKITDSLIDHLGNCERFYNQAEAMLSVQSAVIALETPRHLELLKIASNDKTRQAIIDSNPEYQRLVGVRDDIEVTLNTLKRRFEKYKNEQFSLQNLSKELFFTQNKINQNLRHSYDDDSVPVGMSKDEYKGKY